MLGLLLGTPKTPHVWLRPRSFQCKRLALSKLDDSRCHSDPFSFLKISQMAGCWGRTAGSILICFRYVLSCCPFTASADTSNSCFSWNLRHYRHQQGNRRIQLTWPRLFSHVILELGGQGKLNHLKTVKWNYSHIRVYLVQFCLNMSRGFLTKVVDAQR